MRGLRSSSGVKQGQIGQQAVMPALESLPDAWTTLRSSRSPGPCATGHSHALVLLMGTAAHRRVLMNWVTASPSSGPIEEGHDVAVQGTDRSGRTRGEATAMIPS